MGAVLVVLFLVIPVAEIYVIVQVGQQIGALPTVALLLLESALGAWIVKREGRRSWRALTGALGTGRLPGSELSDAALVLVGGTLLLTPGFLTDIAGFFLILPPTRPLARRALLWFLARRASRLVSRAGQRPFPPSRGPERPSWPGASRARTVQGEVVSDDGGQPDRPDERPPEH